MAVSTLLLSIALISVVWGTVSSIMITSALNNRGIKINWIFLRIRIIKYVGQYRDITRKETGRTGPWYYSFVIAMNLALATAVIGLILRAQ